MQRPFRILRKWNYYAWQIQLMDTGEIINVYFWNKNTIYNHNNRILN